VQEGLDAEELDAGGLGAGGLGAGGLGAGGLACSSKGSDHANDSIHVQFVVIQCNIPLKQHPLSNIAGCTRMRLSCQCPFISSSLAKTSA